MASYGVINTLFQGLKKKKNFIDVLLGPSVVKKKKFKLYKFKLYSVPVGNIIETCSRT